MLGDNVTGFLEVRIVSGPEPQVCKIFILEVNIVVSVADSVASKKVREAMEA